MDKKFKKMIGFDCLDSETVKLDREFYEIMNRVWENISIKMMHEKVLKKYKPSLN